MRIDYNTCRMASMALILVVLIHFGSLGQSRWQGSLSMGASMPYNNLATSGFPFGLATTGICYGLGADYFLKEKSGITLSTGGSFLGYDREVAGRYFLANVAASTASVTANSYYLHTIQLGFFHHFYISEYIELRAAIQGGWSVLNTPEISVWLDSEPYTDYYYNRGTASSPLVMVELAPYFRLNYGTQIVLSVSWTASNPEIEWQNSDGSQPGSQVLNYGMLGVKLGWAYRFGQSPDIAK